MKTFKSALLESLELMRAGASVDDCVQRYPKHGERLRTTLVLADKVSRTPLAAARPQAQERAWKTLKSRAAELREGKRTISVPSVNVRFGWLKPAAVALSLVLAFSASSGAVAFASQDALPDSPLYRVKLMTEDVHLWFVFDEVHEAEILLDQSNERMEEITTMVEQGKDVPENALSAMHERNEKAASILLKHPQETTLRARVLTQAQRQEERLVDFWPKVPQDSHPTYAQAVAHLHNIRLDGGAGNAFVTVRPEELTGGILSISGQAEEVGDGVWNVGGVEVRIDERTIGRQELQPGSAARFVVARATNGRLHALSLSNLNTGPVPSGAVVSGAIEEVTKDGISIAGNFIQFSDGTLQTTPVRVGDRVRITLETTPDGIVADSVSPLAASASQPVQSFSYEGTIAGDVSKVVDRWTVGGREFRITASTAVDARAGSAKDGARAQIEALNRAGQLEALRVTILKNEDAADTATLIGTFDGYDETGLWLISGVPVFPPETGEDPAEGSLISVDVRIASPDLVTTAYEVVESPDDPSLVRLQGTIIAIDGTRWSLEFGQVRVSSTAEVNGDPETGMRVMVWGERGVDGNLQARYVRVLDDEPVLTPSPTAPPSASPSPTPAP